MPVAFLWHLHQPDYRDPETRIPVMPWVRLHGLRGYTDLVTDIVEHGVAATVNVVPSLLDQVDHYALGGVDAHLALTRREAVTLTPAETATIAATFVAGNPGMIEIHPAYRTLAARVRAGAPLDSAELRDLQVWSTLAWFGDRALRRFPELVHLRRQGRGFTETDKAAMLAAQSAILADLPALFARVSTSSARLSTTPYFHPILPLLVDNRHARRCLPHLEAVPDSELPYAFPEDVGVQLRRARARFGGLGGPPRGLWPSEGSVSPEILPWVAEAGFSWLASDEGVLGRSARDGRGLGGWDLGHGLRGFFRDRELSDKIGFDYARRPAEEAAAELLGLARSRGKGVVVIALDGENPWEAFADAGAAFRRALHRGMAGDVAGITLDDAATEPPVGRIRRLWTGSWIHADFGIWIGHPEDRAAWKALAEARRAIAHAPPDRAAAAFEKLLPATASDFPWWYGDEFRTPFAGTFDALFRAHVRAAWRALDVEPPASLDAPIGRASPVDVVLPQGPVDGSLAEPASFLRWAAAGRATWSRGSTMARAGEPELRFGWSADALWVRVDADGEAVTAQLDGAPAVASARAGRVAVFQFERWTGAVRRLRFEVDGVAFPPDGPVELPATAPDLLVWSA